MESYRVNFCSPQISPQIECIGESDMPLCTDIVSGLPLLLDPTIADRKASAEAQCDYLKDASIFGPCHSIEVNQVQVHLFFLHFITSSKYRNLFISCCCNIERVCADIATMMYIEEVRGNVFYVADDMQLLEEFKFARTRSLWSA